jgi:spectrin beta
MRLNKLNEANKLYQYLKEVDELADWINEQIQTASSEEYGHDFEHLQVLFFTG